jgi:CO/xanthine dehydrogenase FAD-binding subunit
VRLQALVDHAALPDWLRALVKAEAPSTFRNMRTLYSVIQAASPESSLLAALLVCDAQVSVMSGGGTQQLALTAYLREPAPGIITAVHIRIDGRGAEARLARTPADSPIIAAVARRGDDGKLRLALCGVAATPILIETEAIRSLQPYGDFRGSAEYRREMAAVLSQRVISALA